MHYISSTQHQHTLHQHHWEYCFHHVTIKADLVVLCRADLLLCRMHLSCLIIGTWKHIYYVMLCIIIVRWLNG